MSHTVKDALLTVDDFRPALSERDRKELYRAADALIRGNANTQARQRLDQTAKEGRSYSPRCGLRSTGELPPIGQSLRGRMCLQKLKKGAIRTDWLSGAQRAAAEGVFARLTTSYIQWLATHLDRLQIIKGEAYWRDEFAHQLGRNAYARTAANLAECYVGFAHFVGFGVSVGALDQATAKDLCKRCRIALLEIGYEQENYIQQEEATEEFIAMLRGALDSGIAEIRSSNPPGLGYGGKGTGSTCIGYYDAPTEKIWLIGDVAYNVVREFARRSGVDVGKASDVWAALADKGLLTIEPPHYSVKREVKARNQRIRVRELPVNVVVDGEDIE